MEVINESVIRIDRGTQFRARLNDDRVKEYAELFVDSNWPFETPCEVFFDGSEYYLVDGFHRYHAARTAGHDGIACNVRTGTLRDAIKFALSANAKHGLHRSNEDKRKAVSFALADNEWSKLSSRMIADMCGVSDMFVGNMRKDSGANRLHLKEKRVGKDGKEQSATKPKQEAKTETKQAPLKDAWEDVVDEPEPVSDDTPEALKPVEWFKDQLKLINELKRNLNSVQESPGTELIVGRQRVLLREIENVKGGFVAACPYAICPRCEGKTCSQCGNMGWVNKQRFDELGAN